MPFKSEAQRKWMFANHPDMASEWQQETPAGTRLPRRVKHSYLQGLADAFDQFGFKAAAEEIRLKIPHRQFHGWDSAFKNEKQKNEKKADGHSDNALEPQATPDAPVERLTELLRQIHLPGETPTDGAQDPLDRPVMWSGPAVGDGSAGHGSDMGQNTNMGMV